MKTFKAIIETRKGIVHKEFEAEDLLRAEKMAKRYGRVISIKKIFSTKAFESKMSMADRQVLLQRLAAMQQSKVGAGEALTLMEATFSGTIKRIASTMLKKVEAGDDLGQAMESIGPPDFPRNTVALIKAGSKGGDTASALRNAAEFEAEMDRIKRESGSGIWSGVFGFLSAVGITFGTTRYMGPQVLESDLMQIAGDSIDVDWAITLGTVAEIGMGFFAIIFLFLFLLGTIGRLAIPKHADNVIMKIPFYKDLVLSRNNYITLYGLSLLVNSGVPMEQALGLSAEASPKGQMQEDLKRSVKHVKEGKPWATAMRNLEATDRAALGSSLDREGVAMSLDALSKQYRSLYATRSAAVAPILQGISVIFLVISGVVLFGMTIVPILQFATSGLQ